MAQIKSWSKPEQLFVEFCKEHGLSVSFTSGPESSPTIRKIETHVFKIARQVSHSRMYASREEMFEGHELLMWDFVDFRNRLLFEVKNPKTSRMSRPIRANSSRYLTRIQEWRARMFDKRGWLCYLVLLQDSKFLFRRIGAENDETVDEAITFETLIHNGVLPDEICMRMQQNGNSKEGDFDISKRTERMRFVSKPEKSDEELVDEIIDRFSGDRIPHLSLTVEHGDVNAFMINLKYYFWYAEYPGVHSKYPELISKINTEALRKIRELCAK